MKKILVIITNLLFFAAAYAQQSVATDSIAATLDEVVVMADTQTETAKKVIFRPTKLEKRHSTNGYTLLANISSSTMVIFIIIN